MDPPARTTPEALPALQAVQLGTPMDTQENGDIEPATELVDQPPTPLSKNALKKQRKQEAYEAARPERKARFKEKKLARKEVRRAAIASGELVLPPRNREAIKKDPSDLRVLIDCSFDQLMTDGEIKSMCAQITRCYSDNRTALRPCNLLLSGWNDRIAGRFATVFKDQQKNWNRAKFYETDYMDDAGRTVDNIDKNDLIYLSADSEDVIDTIDETKVYIIGGIVDKNRHKNLCQDKANRQGIKSGRLPINEYIALASRKVLTVNQVFEIMSKWLAYRDWEKAFLEVIPKRKMNEKPVDPANGEEPDGTSDA